MLLVERNLSRRKYTVYVCERRCHIIGGVRFPEVDEPQEVTTQLSCKGVSCILKKCGLTVEQYDSEGQRIGEMNVLDS